MRFKPFGSMWRSALKLTLLLLFPCVFPLPSTSARPWTPQHLHKPGRPLRPNHLDLLAILQKRECHLGLSCTYSHLSSMAAQRTLQRMMVDYMHNCVNDPRCSPGRRKRSTSLSTGRDRLRSKGSTDSLGLGVLPGR